MLRLFSVFIPTSIVGLLISEVVLVLLCYATAIALQSSISWQVDPSYIWFYLQNENGIPRLATVTATMIGGLYMNDCYTQLRIRSRLVFVQQLCLVIGTAFLLQALLSYTHRVDWAMPRQAMMIGSGACLLLVPMWRSAYSKLSILVLGAEKIVFVGTHPLQFKLAEQLMADPAFAMEVVGFVVEGSEQDPLPVPVLGDLRSLPACLQDRRVDRLVIGLNQQNDPAMMQALLQQAAGYRTVSMGDIYELVFGRVAISQLQPMQILFRKGLVPSDRMLRAQALYSWVIAFAGLIVLSPFMIITAIAVRLNSRGPVLFRQVRTGLNKKPFVLYKFRSMTVDAEAHTGAMWAQENDPRVTSVGRVIRKYRLDELPQLFNVLRNEMAIVGPRPERPEFVKVLAEQIPFYDHRHSVKPGITGWAQINYRYGNTVQDTIIKLEYDLYYIKNFAPQLDFYVMFHTAKTMLLTRGAY